MQRPLKRHATTRTKSLRTRWSCGSTPCVFKYTAPRRARGPRAQQGEASAPVPRGPQRRKHAPPPIPCAAVPTHCTKGSKLHRRGTRGASHAQCRTRRGTASSTGASRTAPVQQRCRQCAHPPRPRFPPAPQICRQSRAGKKMQCSGEGGRGRVAGRLFRTMTVREGQTGSPGASKDSDPLLLQYYYILSHE